MPQRIPPDFDMHRALALIGLTLHGLDQHVGETVPDDGKPDVWPRRRKVYKDVIKRAQHKTLRKTHPDLYADEREREHALERTKRVNEAVNILLLIQPSPPRPRPQPRPRPFFPQTVILSGYSPFGMWSSTSTSTTTATTAGGFNPFVTIRVHRT